MYFFFLLFIYFVLFHSPTPIGLEYLHPISGKLVITCKIFAKWTYICFFLVNF